MSDRDQLERAEARELFTTWLITKQRVLTPERRKRLVRLYGQDSIERITAYMAMEKNANEAIFTATSAQGSDGTVAKN